MFRFAGFELDQQRATLRGPNGEAIKLRPKTFDMLRLFAANPRRILSKQELMDTIWPNVRIGEDGLFQCIREIRAALADEQRQMVKLVSGRGYVFEVDVTTAQAPASLPTDTAEPGASPAVANLAGARLQPFAAHWPMALALVAGLGLIIGLAVAAPTLVPNLAFNKPSPSIMVMPIGAPDDDAQTASMAASVTEGLVDGLAKIDEVSVVLAPTDAAAGSAPRTVSASPAQTDYVVHAELRKRDQTWVVQARLIKTAGGTVVPIDATSVDMDDADRQMQASRLTAALGHPLSLRINELMQAEQRPVRQDARQDSGLPLGNAKAAIAQAIASISQISRERFGTAQAMLEKALAENPDNADLSIALAGVQLRGIQMVWYSTEDAAVAEKSARQTLERALRIRPNNVPVLEAYCRFLMTTNEFVDTLVACARVMTFTPWNGMALYQSGIAQLQLGRFDDALGSFQQANRYNTPSVARWTWPLGIALTYAVMGRNEEALPWLEKSLAITSATGRSHMLLAATLQQLGRTQEAKAALAKGMDLRPGSTAQNFALPTKNSSTAFLEAVKPITRAAIEAGLPER